MALSKHEFAKIRTLEFQTKRSLQSSLSGDRKSFRRGYGLEFDQLREYIQGDDIRFVDWSSSARNGRLMVKEYLHEHTPTILVAFDISASTMFGSLHQSVTEIMRDIAVILLYAASHSDASVGLLLFDSKVVRYYAPAKGARHHFLIQEVMNIVPQQRPTNIGAVLRSLAHFQKKSALVFLLSDFIDDGYDADLVRLNRRHEIIAIRILDTVLRQLPSVGMVHMRDNETGGTYLLTTKHAQECLTSRLHKQNAVFVRSGVDVLDIKSEINLVDSVVRFFSQRMISCRR